MKADNAVEPQSLSATSVAARDESRAGISTAVSILLYALELTAFVVLLALYKKVGRPMSVFLPTPAGRMMIVAIAACALLAGVLLFALRVRRRRQRFLPTVALNLGVLVVLFVTAEITIRAHVSPTPAGPFFGNKLLLPRNWQRESARNRALLSEAEARHSYLAPDADLGWSIRPNARSKDYNLEFELAYLRGLRHSSLGDMEPSSGPRVSVSDDSVYLSSVEGLRSPRAGMSFAALPHRHRIALVGDSFTFGLEVRYEETWGYQLERALGGDYQVLNFGVDAYGVDQSYLRFRRDVIPWHPDIVILGVVSDDLHRTMCVYAFLCFQGGQMPFSKPRFVLAGDSLQLLPRPTTPLDGIFARPAIGELPLIEYDHDFDPYEWDWHSYDLSYAIRYLLTRYRRWSVPGPAVNDSALAAVNVALFRAFVRDVLAIHATPVVLFFPSRSELPTKGDGPFAGRDVLRQSGVSFIDTTPCITSLPQADRFVVLHFSPQTNAAVAHCLRERLPGLFGARRQPSSSSGR